MRKYPLKLFKTKKKIKNNPNFDEYGNRRDKHELPCLCSPDCPKKVLTALNEDGSRVKDYYNNAHKMRAYRRRKKLERLPVTA